MAKVKAIFYLPVQDNDGRSLNPEIKEILTEIFLRFLGWTCMGYYKGAFKMSDGTQSLDKSGAYSVVLDESRVDELEQVLREFKNKTTQEAIYLEIQRNIDFRFIR